jgi:hypothetical protein
MDKEIEKLNALIKEYGGVDSYTTDQAVELIEQLNVIIRQQGLDPETRAGFFDGICRVFNIELINRGNYEHGKYVFAPNHISEFDGPIFGTIVPNVLVVAKSDWVSNSKLNRLLEKLCSLISVVRTDKSSGMKVLKGCIDHLNESQDAVVNIFVQQTIADIDITTPGVIATGAWIVAQKASAPVIPVYCEQVSTDHPTRIVFGEPIVCGDKDDFGKLWLESELALRDSIKDPAARKPVLCEKHQKPISQRAF